MNAQSYYANSINKQAEKLDEYDLHVCRVANAFASHKIEEVRAKAFKTGIFGVYTNILNNIFDETLKELK